MTNHEHKINSQIPPLTQEVDILARTLYGEARGESVRGKEAVAAVIVNRVNRARLRGGHYWWGSSIIQVCHKPWQFSCWNANDTNCQKIKAVDRTNKTFLSCIRIAMRAINGTLKDPTGGSTHYHVKGLFPPWAKGRSPKAEIGRHQFYHGIL